MCRLFALTSRDPVSPMLAIDALNVMKEGHDGSGVGLFLSGLGGPFEELKECPILSGIFTEAGLQRVYEYMAGEGLRAKYSAMFKPETEPPAGTPKRGTYASMAYKVPAEWDSLSKDEIGRELVSMRLDLRAMGEEKGDIKVFSFWPDTIMIKEVGDPLDHRGISPARQGRASRPAHPGPGAAEHQLRHQPVCLPSLLHRRRVHHDQRREHGLRAHQGIPSVQGGYRVRGIPVGLRGVHAHRPLRHQEARARHLRLQARHHAHERRGDGRS